MEYSLTELQLGIMEVLWQEREATVSEVHEALRRDRRVAESTVATLLSRLEARGMVEHRTEGRRYAYRAVVGEVEVRRSIVSEFAGLTQRLFSGDVAGLVSQLLNAREVEPEDLERVRAIIDEKARQLRAQDEEQ